MYIEGFEQLFKLNRDLTAPLANLNKATIELCKQLIQQNLEIMEENFSRCSDQVKQFSNVRKPEDFINLQKNCINENIHASLGNIQKLVQISVGNLEEFSKLYASFQEQSSFTPPFENEKSNKYKKV